MPQFTLPPDPDIPPAVRQIVKDIALLEPVKRVLLYGSRARGDALPRADVDMAIDAPGLTDGQWHDILSMVEKVPTLLKIDCVRLQEQSGPFLEAIIRDGKVLYESEKR